MFMAFAFFLVTMTIMFSAPEKEFKPSSEESLICVRQVTKPSHKDKENEGKEEVLICSKSSPKPVEKAERLDKSRE